MQRLLVFSGLLLLLSQLTGCANLGAASAIISNTQEDYIKSQGGRSTFDKLGPKDMAIHCSMYAQIADLDGAADCSEHLINRFQGSQEKEILYHVISTGFLIRAFSEMEQGKYQQAIDTADKAIKIINSKKLDKNTNGIFTPNYGPFFLRSKYSMHDFKAIAYYRMGNKAKAEQELNNVSLTLDNIDELVSGLGFMKDAVINDLAHAYALTNRYIDAANLYVKDDSMSAEEIIKDRERSVLLVVQLNKILDVSLFYIAKADLLKGNNKRALALFKELESYNSIARAPTLHWLYWYEYSNLLVKLNDIDNAIAKLKNAVNVIESQRSTLKTEIGKIGFIGDKQKVYSQLINLLLKQQKYGEAFIYAERAKSRALVDLLAQKKQIRGGHIKNHKKAERLVSEIALAESKFARLKKPLEGDTERALVIKKHNELKKLNPELASLISVDAPDLKKIQSLLPEKEVLIEYYANNSDLYAFVVTHNDVHAIQLDGKKLNKSVAHLRRLLQRRSSTFKQISHKLYSRLVEPLASRGWIKYKNLTIVPHGSLHYVPFDALVSDKKYLLDDYDIRIMPSASVLSYLEKPISAHDKVMIIGNPALDNKSLDLPGAEKEARAIAKIETGATLLLRNQATETSVKKQMDKFQKIHIASHGVFNPDAPLSSGLLLTKDTGSDGMLTVNELFDLKLNADLVTLSACETALGKISNGDDVVGFTRAFLYAGARSIVSSLWKVDDRATSLLMKDFYKQQKNNDKRNALRKAQLKVKKQFKHPYFWAAFQLTGANI